KPRSLAGMARGGDDGGAGELGECNGGRAHAARCAGDENVVVHPHVKSVGDDAVGGRSRPHGRRALIEVEIGPDLDPVPLGAGDEDWAQPANVVWRGRSMPREGWRSPRMLASESVFSGLVMRSTRPPGASVVTLAPTAATSPATSRPSCIGMGKARRPWMPP